MKIVLIGAKRNDRRTGSKTALAGAGHEIVKVGRKSGDFQVEIENRESVRKLLSSRRLVRCPGHCSRRSCICLRLRNSPAEKWQFSLGSKLMGQINLVQEAIPFINERGSFTLISGVLNDEPIFASAAAAAVSGRAGGFLLGLPPSNFPRDCGSMW